MTFFWRDHDKPIIEPCSICYSEQGDGWVSHKLGNIEHIFHKTCIKEWINHSQQLDCPVCQLEIKRGTLDSLPYRLAIKVNKVVRHPFYPFAVNCLLICPMSYYMSGFLKKETGIPTYDWVSATSNEEQWTTGEIAQSIGLIGIITLSSSLITYSLSSVLDSAMQKGLSVLRNY